MVHRSRTRDIATVALMRGGSDTRPNGLDNDEHDLTFTSSMCAYGAHGFGSVPPLNATPISAITSNTSTA